MTRDGSSGSGLRTRRSVLATVGGLAGTAVAGCLGSDSASVSVLAAGSLAHTFEDHVGPAFEDETGFEVHGEYYGANAVMRMVEDRTKHPDVIVSADATLLRDRLYGEFTDWDVEFATNSVGIGYDEETTFGRGLENGEPWYELALATEEGDISIGDPDLDPLGYRAVQAFELAEAEHGIEGLRDELLELVSEEPDEPQMMAGVESGSRAASVVYRNMAVDHGMPFLEFPDAYNFGEPGLADHYATVEFTTDEEGYTAEGRPVLYNATVNDEADEPDAGRDLVQFLADESDPLVEAGLTVGDSLPRPEGDLPEAIDA
ncbi:extracellular solute-binding protein [Natronococcus sp. A-GB7]|uniref:extracellular solute-binding protein n=1 Tax=Natronococcus sp. A-GB7 TaxID=3037649 RepID=UPI00241CF337|nr:extracellular solute-binding protein [Natronococcus sp. A-GB7]MDG5817867.1 extracellular solute-binding protein [Natronococcus sp. A-GB7]